ncbi:hypothetical protein LY78DRAFT_472438 [Colletotrichum sublineola]|nr:hypothetical protein LY78DRAFT_472438 [Colletotrichum sublineola]
MTTTCERSNASQEGGFGPRYWRDEVLRPFRRDGIQKHAMLSSSEALVFRHLSHARWDQPGRSIGVEQVRHLHGGRCSFPRRSHTRESTVYGRERRRHSILIAALLNGELKRTGSTLTTCSPSAASIPAPAYSPRRWQASASEEWVLRRLWAWRFQVGELDAVPRQWVVEQAAAARVYRRLRGSRGGWCHGDVAHSRGIWGVPQAQSSEVDAAGFLDT